APFRGGPPGPGGPGGGVRALLGGGGGFHGGGGGHRGGAGVEALVAAGAVELAHPRALADWAEVVVLCLPTSEAVEAVVTGRGGLLDSGKGVLTVVDCTSADPASTRRLHAQLASRGWSLVDAPLTRTPKEAAEGRLNALVGAEPEALARVQPVLEAFCENIFPVGPPGSGHALKLVNNFISLGTAALLAEALTVATKAGVDLAALRTVVSAGGANSNTFQKLTAWLLDGDEAGFQFTLANAAKDVGYYRRLAETVAGPKALVEAVDARYQALTPGREGQFVPRLVAALAREYDVVLGPPTSFDQAGGRGPDSEQK
ncbi:MAG: NAD(P)-dependent oxidoreductase, partial [Candidatus Competibacterales bacterium]